MTPTPKRAAPWALLLLAALCLLAYAPSLRLPLIEDDYPVLTEGQFYGSPGGLFALIHAPVFRLRATSYWLIFLLWQRVHLTPWAYHAASLILHIACTWLVYGVGLLWPPMRRAALWAAVFFAVQEGHQEAVMWFTAINELLLFLFGIGSLFCWMLADSRRRPWIWRATSVLLFAFAVASKESAVILPAFFLLVRPIPEWKREIPRMLPHIALAALTLLSILALRSSSYRFNDGSFSLDSPFWITWPRGLGRILWFWGWLSAGAILLSKTRETVRGALLALSWIAIALVPYSFLTYSTQIPSRQTYLASVGLVFLFGLALQRFSRRTVAAVLVILVLHNVGYLWTKKRRQFLTRAEPTEALIRLARQTTGPIWVQCFPRPTYIAKEAVRLAAGRDPGDLVWTESEAAERHAAVSICLRE